MTDPAPDQFEKLPPHSIESEMCLLGSMLLDRDVIAEARLVVPRDAFYLADHQTILDAILSAYDRRGTAIDAVIVREELVSRQMLDEIGGTAYLGSLLSAVPSAAHWRTYAEIVVDRWTWREGIRATNEYLRRAYAPHRAMEAAEACRAVASKMANAAAAANVDGFVPVGDLLAAAAERAPKGQDSSRYLRTKVGAIDYMVGGLPVGGLTVVGARPRISKSALLKQMLVNLAADGVPTALISVEERESKVGANVLAYLSGVRNQDVVYGRVTDGERLGHLSQMVARYAGLPFYVNDKPAKQAEVVAAIAVAARKYGAKAIGVDYLQLIEGNGNENKNVEIANLSRAIKNAFKHFDVAGIVAAQLNRGNEKGGEPRIPQLADLRDSGAIEADGDVILLLHRKDVYHEGEDGYEPDNAVDINVAKNKGGPGGVIRMRWNGDAQAYEDWDGQGMF